MTDSIDIGRLLLTGSPAQVAAACEQMLGSRRQRLDAVALEALRGDYSATRRYLELFRECRDELLATARIATVDFRVVDESGAVYFSQLKLDWAKVGGFYARHLSDDAYQPLQLKDALDLVAPRALLSAWGRQHGPALGVTCSLVQELRNFLPEAEPLEVPRSTGVVPENFRRFFHDVTELLDQPLSEVERIQRTFGLSHREMAWIMGVSERSIMRWLKSPQVPGDHAEKVSVVAEIAWMLMRHLNSAEIPGIARRRAAAYGNKSMLYLISRDQHYRLLEITRRSLQWSSAA